MSSFRGLKRVHLPAGKRKDCAAGCGETLIGSADPLDPQAMAWKDPKGRHFCTRACAAARKRIGQLVVAAI